MELVRFKTLKEMGIVDDRTTLARRIKNEGFPKAIALGGNSIAWDLDEVKAWVESRPRRAPKVYEPPPKKQAAGAAA